MSHPATYWFSPAPSEVSASRISLDFDLRAADLFFRELVVPELGRVWFARQLSWPLAAHALHEELTRHGSNISKPTAICHGIEALACKLEYYGDRQFPSRRILGRRAFQRDDEHEQLWSFQQLRQPTNYVRNTHRQAATRALRQDGGLGFVRGARFDFYQLEPVGRALADAFLEQRVGKGGTSLRKWLLGWLEGDREIPGWPQTLLEALSPEHVTDDERALVRSRLLGTSTSACEKRQRLASALGRAADLPGIDETVVARLRDRGYREQADEVGAARAFGAMLDRARDLVARLTVAMEPEHSGIKLVKLASDSAIRGAVRNLRSAGKKYVERANRAAVMETTSHIFADALVARDDSEVIRVVVLRADEILGLADGSMFRGPLFRVVDGINEPDDLEDGAATIEPDRTGRTFRIANMHALLRDVDPRGAL